MGRTTSCEDFTLELSNSVKDMLSVWEYADKRGDNQSRPIR